MGAGFCVYVTRMIQNRSILMVLHDLQRPSAYSSIMNRTIGQSVNVLSGGVARLLLEARSGSHHLIAESSAIFSQGSPDSAIGNSPARTSLPAQRLESSVHMF